MQWALNHRYQKNIKGVYLTVAGQNQLRHIAVQKGLQATSFGDKEALHQPTASFASLPASSWQSYAIASNGPLVRFGANWSKARPVLTEAHKFGTAGFRPGRPITADEVRAIAHAAADQVIQTHRDSTENPLVVIGRDTRESSRQFISLLKKIMTSRGVDVLEAQGPLSTPLASYLVSHSKQLDPQNRQASLAIILTASHNPYLEGGIKLLGPTGVNAQEIVTKAIESYQTQHLDSKPLKSGASVRLNPTKAYVTELKQLFSPDDFSELGEIPLDIHYGAGAAMRDVLKALKVPQTVLRTGNPPIGYNSNSEPKAENLTELIATVKSQNKPIGIALDGDADRFAAVDETGAMIPTTDCLLLALDYLMDKKGKGWEGIIGRSQATSRVLDALYQSKGGHNEVFETPVGFKWYEQLFDGDNKKKVILAMESSGGATSGRHSVQEKDGLFMDLVLLAAANKAKKEGLTVTDKIHQIKANLPTQYAFYEDSLDLRKARDGAKDRVDKAMKALFDKGGIIGSFAINTPLSAQQAETLKERNQTNNADGYKFYLGERGEHWVLVRPSGTEAKFRIYVDASGETSADASQNKYAILKAIKDQINHAAA